MRDDAKHETEALASGHCQAVERNARALLSLLPLLLATSGCTPPLGDLGEPTPADDGGDDELPPEADRLEVLELDDGALDLLFVIDNSGSMGSEQARTAQAVAELVQQMGDELGSDLRIAFTTTDNGNPWCGASGPEGGGLRLSACTDRLEDFVFNGAETIDATQEACLDICGLESLPILATTTHVDGVAAPRPWIEVGPEGSNLDEVTLEQALACAAPQGITGCGFEQPLESMKKALERSNDPLDPSYGFVRPWARLAVVLVTDEVDCSYDPAWETIFLPDGSHALWSDPEAASPNSGACWNASVACDGEGPELGDCHPQDYDVDGNPTDPANAVIWSLQRYVDALQAIDESKAEYRPPGSVSVALIGGVPQGYADGTEELVYTRGMTGDPQFATEFGVDPGCESTTGQAVPPVRELALAEQFPVDGSPSVHSVCSESYEPAMNAIGHTLAAPALDTVACMPGCLVDTDEAAQGTQAQCDVVMQRADADGRETSLVPACDAATGDEPCYRLRVDEAAAQCAAQGSNAELELVLPEGFAVKGRITIETACEMAAAGSC
jgi:hypothetical protein